MAGWPHLQRLDVLWRLPSYQGEYLPKVNKVPFIQCAQIGRFIALWAAFFDQIANFLTTFGDFVLKLVDFNIGQIALIMEPNRNWLNHV